MHSSKCTWLCKWHTIIWLVQFVFIEMIFVHIFLLVYIRLCRYPFVPRWPRFGCHRLFLTRLNITSECAGTKIEAGCAWATLNVKHTHYRYNAHISSLYLDALILVHNFFFWLFFTICASVLHRRWIRTMYINMASTSTKISDCIFYFSTALSYIYNVNNACSMASERKMWTRLTRCSDAIIEKHLEKTATNPMDSEISSNVLWICLHFIAVMHTTTNSHTHKINTNASKEKMCHLIHLKDSFHQSSGKSKLKQWALFEMLTFVANVLVGRIIFSPFRRSKSKYMFLCNKEN